MANVVWQRGDLQENIPSTELYPVLHLDELEFFPGDFVNDKRGKNLNTDLWYCYVSKLSWESSFSVKEFSRRFLLKLLFYECLWFLWKVLVRYNEWPSKHLLV